MEEIVIRGGNPLNGEVEIGGAKNAVLAILAGTVLAQDVCVLHNVPDIKDVHIVFDILEDLGGTVTRLGPHDFSIDTSTINKFAIEEQLAGKLRASYYFLGSLLGRFNKARVATPGGCDFGNRPMDMHLNGFHMLGSEYTISFGMINCTAEKLTGASIVLNNPSVGATINIMLAATKARGLTIIENAAKEPHIVDLANFLNTIGAKIIGAGTNTIKIHGVNELHGCDYTIIPDQIEAGTYMLAVAAAGGDVKITNVIPKHLEIISDKLIDCGVYIEEGEDFVRIVSDQRLKATNVATAPYPGFPTDMQPQMGVLMAIADGRSNLFEKVWENRFQYLSQLQKMGANVVIAGNQAIFEGVSELTGAHVIAHDLRAGAAMIIAGLVATGTTKISKIKYIKRGYEGFIEKFNGIGADMYISDGTKKIVYTNSNS